MSQTPHISPFDAIRHEDEQIDEYWSARELYKIIGYTEWRNFNSVVIKRAMKACEENGRAVSEHFVRSYKMSKTGQGGQRKAEDVLLSRYAAYLVVMNGDPKMPIVAMGQEYFAEQTRRQELAATQADAIEALPEGQNGSIGVQNSLSKMSSLLPQHKTLELSHRLILRPSRITGTGACIRSRKIRYTPAKVSSLVNTSPTTWAVTNWSPTPSAPALPGKS